jgi:hypothetical protein
MSTSLSMGQRIKLARDKADPPVSATMLARLLGYAKPQNSWWRIETGKRGLTPAQVAIIAKALNVSCDWLITGRESRVRPQKRAA